MRQISEIEEKVIYCLFLVKIPKEDITPIMPYLGKNESIAEKLFHYLMPRVEAKDTMTYPEVMEYLRKLKNVPTSPYRKAEKE